MSFVTVVELIIVGI